jgi:hypothetical protein
MKNNGQASEPLVVAAPPTPLTVAATASIASQVVDPFHGPTKVVLSVGGAFHDLQPVSGHVQNDDRNSAQSTSVPPVMVPMPPVMVPLPPVIVPMMPPLITAAAARFHDQVPSHCSG